MTLCFSPWPSLSLSLLECNSSWAGVGYRSVSRIICPFLSSRFYEREREREGPSEAGGRGGFPKVKRKVRTRGSMPALPHLSSLITKRRGWGGRYCPPPQMGHPLASDCCSGSSRSSLPSSSSFPPPLYLPIPYLLPTAPPFLLSLPGYQHPGPDLTPQVPSPTFLLHGAPLLPTNELKKTTHTL